MRRHLVMVFVMATVVGFALPTPTPAAGPAAGALAPAAVITCGGEPQPDPIECKIWRCTNGVWTRSNKTNGSTCTDNNECTLNDKCTNGLCGGTAALAGASCSDGNACTVGDKCDDAKKCVPGAPAVMDDGNPCTSDYCDPGVGVYHAALTNACCTAGLVQSGKACNAIGCSCNALAQCVVVTASTAFGYDGATSMTSRLVRLPSQFCSVAP